VTPYGCHNREIQPGYWVSGMAQVGPEPVLVQVNTWIPHNMSTDCRSDSFGDPRCNGCQWQQAEPFAAPLDGTGGV